MHGQVQSPASDEEQAPEEEFDGLLLALANQEPCVSGANRVTLDPIFTPLLPETKHEVRRALHPQLRELWTHQPLRHKAGTWLDSASDPNNPEAGNTRARKLA